MIGDAAYLLPELKKQVFNVPGLVVYNRQNNFIADIVAESSKDLFCIPIQRMIVR